MVFKNIYIGSASSRESCACADAAPRPPPLPVLEFVSDPGDEVDTLSDELLTTLRDGEGLSPVVPSQSRWACTSLSTALAQCTGRALLWWGACGCGGGGCHCFVCCGSLGWQKGGGAGGASYAIDPRANRGQGMASSMASWVAPLEAELEWLLLCCCSDFRAIQSVILVLLVECGSL